MKEVYILTIGKFGRHCVARCEIKRATEKSLLLGKVTFLVGVDYGALSPDKFIGKSGLGLSYYTFGNLADALAALVSLWEIDLIRNDSAISDLAKKGREMAHRISAMREVHGIFVDGVDGDSVEAALAHWTRRDATSWLGHKDAERIPDDASQPVLRLLTGVRP